MYEPPLSLSLSLSVVWYGGMEGIHFQTHPSTHPMPLKAVQDDIICVVYFILLNYNFLVSWTLKGTFPTTDLPHVYYNHLVPIS